MRLPISSLAIAAFALISTPVFAHTDNDTLANVPAVSVDVTVDGDNNGMTESDIQSHVEDSLKAANIPIDSSSKHSLSIYINTLNANSTTVSAYHVEVSLLEKCTVARGDVENSGILSDTWVTSRLGIDDTSDVKDDVMKDVDADLKEFIDDYHADNPSTAPSASSLKRVTPKTTHVASNVHAIKPVVVQKTAHS